MRTHTRNRKSISRITVGGTIIAMLLFGYSLSLTSLPLEAMQYSLAAASVGINAGVVPNPDNTLAEQLKEKAAQLDAQQLSIQQLQRSLGSSSDDRLGLYSLLASILVLFLVAANFYFDWRRGRGENSVLTKPLAIDLRALRLK